MKPIGKVATFLLVCVVVVPVYAQSTPVVGNHVGCTSKAYMQKLVSYADDRDLVAFKKALIVGVATGECIIFENGEAVFITDTSLFSGLVEVRLKGDTTTYWTQYNSLDLKGH